MTWDYEKLDENYKKKWLPMNDFDGKITGKIVFGLKAWMDENPEERKRLGWIKHIHFEKKEIEEKWPHNPHSQYLMASTRQIDAYTIQDDYHVVDKSEEMMLFEEQLALAQGFDVVDDYEFGGVRIL